jgi:hypothetical protein
MKRFLLLVVLAFAATAAFAADAVDRDMLILDDGTLYSIETVPFEDGVTTSLVLTTLAGGKTTTSVVPESVSGTNGTPTLGYDAASKTLFVVWLHAPNATSSEVLAARYQNEKWDAAIVIDSKAVVRSNLGIRFTHQVQSLQNDGSYADVPALILHAAWWEKGPLGEGAYYAVMPLSRNWPMQPDVHELTEFADLSPRVPGAPVEHEFMRHVSLVAGPSANSVDAIFSDDRTASFYRATLRPVAEARVHITVGVRGPKLGAPHAASFDWSGRTGTITSPDGQTVIFTNTTDQKVMWMTFRDGKWLDVQELALNDKVTVSTAMAALARNAANSQ